MESKARGLSAPHREQYDRFYRDGGWGVAWETAQHEVAIPAERLGWMPGSRVLDLGCGEGIHTEALRDRGLAAVGVDISIEAIRKARASYPEAEFHCSDLADWEPPGPLDAIYCRGMSWYHGVLTEDGVHGVDVPHETARLFSWLVDGGSFALHISTNLSGGESNGCADNPLTAYLNLFLPLGNVAFLCDWLGNPVTTEPPATGIIIGVRKRGADHRS